MKKELSNRQPTYKMKVKDAKTERWMEVGAAWKNEDGSISVRLNTCIVLDSRFGVEPVLFPVESKEDREQFFKRKALESRDKKETVSAEKTE